STNTARSGTRTSNGWMHCWENCRAGPPNEGGAGRAREAGPLEREGERTMEKARVGLPSDHEVKGTRRFDAPRALLDEAYTNPALLPRWLLGPPGWTMPVCEMDVRVGGGYRWRWRSDEDGKEFGFHGEFLEVAPPARLVQIEFYDPGDVGGDMGEGALITT